MAALRDIWAVMDRPDQDAVAADLTLLIGPRADRFLPLYHRMCARSGWRRLVLWSWNGPALMLLYVWFFYRRMPVAGFIVLFGPSLAGALGPVGLVMIPLTPVLLAAGLANSLYILSVTGRLADIDRANLPPSLREAELRRQGGISRLGAWISGILHGITLLSLAGIVWVYVAMALQAMRLP